MYKNVLNSVISKVSTIAPFFGKALFDIELKKIKKTPDTVTPAEIIRIVNQAINPKLHSEMKTTNSVLLAGAAQIQINSQDQIVYASSTAKKIISLVMEQNPDILDPFRALEKHGLVKSVKRVDCLEVWENLDTQLNRFFNVTLCPIYNDAGEKTGLNCIIQDVTLRNAIEKDLIRYSDQLKNEIEERKKAQATLIFSSKMAALGEMAGGVAHEINNPLAVIQLYAIKIGEMLRMSSPDHAELIRVSNRIEQNVYRISSIINGLRKFSRTVDNTQMELNEVNQIIHDTLEFCMEKFKNHGVRVELDLPQTSLKVMCRAVEISQVLLNLLNNSFDAIQELPEKWIKLRINETPDYVEIVATDSGNGIPIPIREAIFQPFFTTKGIGSGTGLGLSISKGIMQSHGGDLILDISGKNTTFIIRLKK